MSTTPLRGSPEILDAEFVEEKGGPVTQLSTSEAVTLARLKTARTKAWTGALKIVAACGMIASSCHAICGA